MCTMEDFPSIEQPPNVVDFFRRGAAQERLTRFVKVSATTFKLIELLLSPSRVLET